MSCRSFCSVFGPALLCVVTIAASAAADVSAPPAPPTPVPAAPQQPQAVTDGQTRPSAAYLREDVQYFPAGPEFRVPSEVPPAPPSPQSQLPAVPEIRCHRGCGLLGSDAFAGDAADEALPQCHPLPCLVEARWRYEPLAPEFAVSSPYPPAASECRPSQGICFPTAVQLLPAGPAPARTGRHTPRRASIAPVVQVAAAAPESSPPLTRLQHLQKAADHLEAAGHPDEAQHLRERAADMQRHARQRLQELREHKRKIEEEIDELQRMTGAVDQVQIRVSILDVDEQKLKESGIDFKMPTALKSATRASLPPTEQPLIAFDLRPAAMAADQLRTLRDCAAAKVLAEPVVVTTNGREATMFSGGSFPIQIPQPDGSIGVEHQECGVRLTTTPQILEDGRLRLDIASDVSVRDFQSARVVDGHTVPGVIRRRFNAQVVTRFGETLVIGGLSQQHQPPSSVAEMLKQIPYQNRLFRPVSDTVAAEGSVRSLVVFVTAEPVSTAAQIPGR